MGSTFGCILKPQDQDWSITGSAVRNFSFIQPTPVPPRFPLPYPSLCHRQRWVSDTSHWPTFESQIWLGLLGQNSYENHGHVNHSIYRTRGFRPHFLKHVENGDQHQLADRCPLRAGWPTSEPGWGVKLMGCNSWYSWFFECLTVNIC